MGSETTAAGDALDALDWNKGDGLLPVIVQAVSYTHLTLPTICSV